MHTQTRQLLTSVHITWPSNLCREESWNAYLLVRHVYASQARPKWNFKCVKWKLQLCVIIVIMKFRVTCTLFIITWRWLISFSHWLIQLMSVCVRGLGTVGSQQRNQIQNSIITVFYVCSEHVYLPNSMCDVMGSKQTNNFKSYSLNTVEGTLNHECELTLLFLSLIHIWWALEQEGVWGPQMSRHPHFLSHISKYLLSTPHGPTTRTTFVVFFQSLSPPLSRHFHLFSVFPLQLLLASIVGISITKMHASLRCLDGTGMKTRPCSFLKHPVEVQWIFISPISESFTRWQTRWVKNEDTCGREELWKSMAWLSSQQVDNHSRNVGSSALSLSVCVCLSVYLYISGTDRIVCVSSWKKNDSECFHFTIESLCLYTGEKNQTNGPALFH